MTRRLLLLLSILLATALLQTTHATTPPDPSTCDTSKDVPNTQLSLSTLLDGYQAIATYGTNYGINATCLNNALSKLASCQTDLGKVSGCCSQSCWDALREPAIAGDCLNSLVLGTCQLAASPPNGTNATSIAGLVTALFYTYDNCVDHTLVPYTCDSYTAMYGSPATGTPSSTSPAPYGGMSYGGIGYGSYGAYGGYGGIGYGGVGYGGYGAFGVGYGGYPGYGGYFYVGYGSYGVAYMPTAVRRAALEGWQRDTDILLRGRTNRRLRESSSSHRRSSSALGRVLRRLRQH